MSKVGMRGAWFLIGLMFGVWLIWEILPMAGHLKPGGRLIYWMITPIAVMYGVMRVLTMITLNERTIEVSKWFVFFLDGLQICYWIIAGMVLVKWYFDPNTPQLEPLFVSAASALAVLEYCKRKTASTIGVEISQ